MDSAPSPISDDVVLQNDIWDRKGQIEIEQDLPLRTHIAGIFGEIRTGDR